MAVIGPGFDRAYISSGKKEMFKVKIYTKLYGLGGEKGCLVFISLFFPIPPGTLPRAVFVSVCVFVSIT